MHRFLLALLALLLVPGAGSASAAPSRQERTTAVFFRETQNWVAPPSTTSGAGMAVCRSSGIPSPRLI
jgi:hypothetical protein